MANWKDRAKDLAAKGMESAQTAKEQYDQRQTEKATDQAGGEQPIMTITSHDPGKNAIVSLFTDRIERVKERSALSVSRANQDAEVIPIARVSHVRAEKAGFRTNVRVNVGGEDIVFRVSHDEAREFKDAIMKRILDKDSGATAAPAPPADDPADQIRKLGELRDQGLLTDEEFQAKKKQILGL